MVKSGFVVALLLAALPAQEEARVFVEVSANAAAYASQPLEVVILVSYDAAWFEEHGVSLFRQRVDVPFHLDVPWLLASPDRAVSVVPCKAELAIARVAIGDRIVAGKRLLQVQRDGRSYEQIELRWRWLPLADGVHKIAPVTVRFAYANEFREHLLRGREPVDQQDQRVMSAGSELRVLPIPKDAPSDWAGAVGQFAILATSGGEQVHVGEVFQVEVTIVGEGNLERLAAIKPPVVDGFHVQGVVEKRVENARRFVLDVLALRPGLTEMPGVSFVTFAPLARQFATLTSDPVPVRVLPQRPGVALSKNVRELIDEDAASQEAGMSAAVIRWGFIALMVFGLLLHRRGRARNGKRALHDAVHELRLATTVGGDPERTAEAFERVMTRVAGGGPFSTPSIWKGLQARGVAAEGLERLRALHAELDAARFGGPLPDAEAVMDAVETVVAAC